MKIHHIGYAVNSIDDTLNELKKIGYVQTTEIVDDVNRGVRICFVDNGGYLIELVQGISEKSPVTNILKKVGVGTYHICYVTDDIENEIKLLKKEKYMLVDKVSLAPAISNKSVVAFLYKISVGLIELVGEINE